MERYKRRFSIDAPLPYNPSLRRQSEPVAPSLGRLPAAFPTDRRYSTALNTPMCNMIAPEGDKIRTHQGYSSNSQVRKLSMSIALQEALYEEYGHTATYGLPIVYTPPPEQLYTSYSSIILSQQPSNTTATKSGRKMSLALNINKN